MEVVNDYVQRLHASGLYPDKFICHQKNGNQIEVEEQGTGKRHQVLTFCTNDVLGMAQDKAGNVAFLVNDVPDVNDYPDTLHFEDGSTELVTVRESGSVDGEVSGGNLTVGQAPRRRVGNADRNLHRGSGLPGIVSFDSCASRRRSGLRRLWRDRVPGRLP